MWSKITIISYSTKQNFVRKNNNVFYNNHNVSLSRKLYNYVFPPHGYSCGSETGTLFLCIIQPEVSNSLLLQSLFKMYSNFQNTTLIKCRLLKVRNHKLRHPKVSAKSKDTNNWHVVTRELQIVIC